MPTCDAVTVLCPVLHAMAVSFCKLLLAYQHLQAKSAITRLSTNVPTSPDHNITNLVMLPQHHLPAGHGAGADDDDDDTPAKTRKETRWGWELLNDNKAIWLRSASDVEDEEYDKFYQALSKVCHTSL